MLLLGILSLATCATCLRINVRREIEERQLDYELPPPYAGPFVPSFNISVPVDHFNESDTRTYNNRYWVNDTYYQPGGPVFLVDYGESGVTERAAAEWLAETNATSSTMALARHYQGLAILWEHRYYGYSLPIPFVTNESSYITEPEGAPQGFDYLTIDQALEDVAYFATNISSGGYQRDDMNALLPSNAPWIFLGGSYPGDRAAWMRIRSPEIIYASWASSAVVQSKVIGSDYFNEIERSIPSNCSTDSRAIIAYLDQVLSGDSTSPEYIEVQRLAYAAYSYGFRTVSDDDYSASDFYNLSSSVYWDTGDIAASFDYGYSANSQAFGPNLAQIIFCDYLQSYNPGAEGSNTTDPYVNVVTNPGNAEPSAEGFLATHNNNLTLALQAYAFANAKFEFHVMNVLNSLVAVDVLPNFLQGLASWQWQVVTQIGWFIGTNPDNVTIRSRFDNYTENRKTANEFTFSEATLAALPAEPDTESLNKYGGWNMNPSNVMFTDGEFDPWRAGSVHSRDEGAPNHQPTTQVPACGVPPENGTRYGIVYRNAAHVWDLLDWPEVYRFSTDEQGRRPVQAGLDLFIAALDVWLPCFNGSGNTGDGSGNVTAPSPYTGQAAGLDQPLWTMICLICAITMMITMI